MPLYLDEGEGRLSHAPLEGNAKEFLGFDGKFHWQLVHYFFSISVDNKRHSFFCRYASLVAIKYLFVIDF